MGQAIFEKSQGTKLFISDGPVSVLPATPGNTPPGVTLVEGSCATNEISMTGGQKTDIDVTSLCSEVQEMANGLAAPGEIALTRNWAAADPFLAELEAADDNEELRYFKVVFPSGNGFEFLAEIRQFSWSVATAGKVAATYNLRLRGKQRRVSGGATS